MIRENQTLLNRLNVALDGILIFLSLLAAYWLRFNVLHGIPSVPFQSYVLAGFVLVPVHLMTYAVFGLYESFRKKRLYQELELLFAANTLDFAFLLMTLFLTRDVNFSRLALGFFTVIADGSLGVKRIFMRKFLGALRRRGRNLKRTMIVGSGALARKYTEEVRRNPWLGYQITGYVSEKSKWKDVKWLGEFWQLPALLDLYHPDEVVAALDIDEYQELPHIIQMCEKAGTKLSLIPFYAQYMPAHPQIDSLNGLQMINLRRIPLDNWGNAFLKRTVDIIGSLLLIVLTSPLMLIAAVGVRLSSPGPIIFKQKRVGLNKDEFYMYKFRSMRINNQADTAWSTNQDNRKTRFGAFIRKYSIDELPQFFNVLKGDMSLVGPRPEIPHFVEQFKEEIPLYMVKHQVRPGITGWAQVNGLRGDTSIEDRIRCDIYYIENWTFFFDIKILLMTVFKGIANQEQLY